MLGRSLRVVCLAVAAWALLFAPGAANADTTGTTGTSRAERVAAAVLAPTFESHSVGLATRACKQSTDGEAASCDTALGHPQIDGLHDACDAPIPASVGHPGPCQAPSDTSISRRGPPLT